MDSEAPELYRRYRPTKFKSVVGQTTALQQLSGLLEENKLPHALLFTGPSGCGKTTLARIVAAKLNCGDSDYEEVNAASFRGIDTIRNIERTCRLACISGDCRVYVIDECHQLTSQGQNAILKLLEDTPAHVYFFLATTDPNKLLKTIQTRCTEIKLGLLGGPHLKDMIERVTGAEQAPVSSYVTDTIVSLAEGSARKALVLLQQALSVNGDDEERVSVLAQSVSNKKSIDLARAFFNKGSWTEIAKIVKEIDDEPETVRRVVIGYAASIMLGGGKLAPRAKVIYDCFRDHYYDVGKPGLINSCYEVFHA